LDKRLDARSGLRFVLADVAAFEPPRGTSFDAILCDMNGDARDAIRQVIRLSVFLRPGAVVVFTLKTPGAVSYDEINALHRTVVQAATTAGLCPFAETHLTYNRLEFTLFFEKSPRPSA
jgi:hypothetical protein